LAIGFSASAKGVKAMQCYKSLWFLRTLVCLFAIMGCASGPGWVKKLPNDPNNLYANTTATSKDMQMAINKAVQDGRVQIAQQFNAKVSGLMRQYMEDTGSGKDSEILTHAENVSKPLCRNR
jgi:hypothetical protein